MFFKVGHQDINLQGKVMKFRILATVTLFTLLSVSPSKAYMVQQEKNVFQKAKEFIIGKPKQPQCQNAFNRDIPLDNELQNIDEVLVYFDVKNIESDLNTSKIQRQIEDSIAGDFNKCDPSVKTIIVHDLNDRRIKKSSSLVYYVRINARGNLISLSSFPYRHSHATFENQIAFFSNYQKMTFVKSKMNQKEIDLKIRNFINGISYSK